MPVHVVQRGNNRAACFERHTDYAMYLRLLAEARERHGSDIHAYVLMTNHVHLLLTGRDDDSVSRTMKRLGESYVRYFNRAHSRTGTLWEGRFHSSVVDTQTYLLRCYRYVERNPVRAGMVTQPRDYTWSSHKANAYGDRDDLVKPHAVYTALAAGEGERRQFYRNLFAIAESPEELQEIRAAINGSFALGSPAFLLELERRLGHRVERMTEGRMRVSSAAPGPFQIMTVV
jgi:putative transposase